MIVDFDNPVSVQYMNKSIESFAPVKDILSITPVQCTTPETLPIRFKKNQEPIPPFIIKNGTDFCRPRFFGGNFDDLPLYQSIMYSHYALICEIALGEEIAIMEHDAALVNEESFRAMIDTAWGKVDGFFPGTIMEFYSLSEEYAQWMVKLLHNFPSKDRYTGPMGVISKSGSRLGWNDHKGQWLLPAKEIFDTQYTSLGIGIENQLFGRGDTQFEPAVKQYYSMSAKNTNAITQDELFLDTMGENDQGTTAATRRDFVVFDEF